MSTGSTKARHDIWTAPRVADGATAMILAGFGGNARREWSAQDAEATALGLTGDRWAMSGCSLRDHLVSAAVYAMNGDRTVRDAAVPCVFCGQTTAPDVAGDWIGRPNAYAAADQCHRRRDSLDRTRGDVGRMWDGQCITLQHHERPTIGAHRLWIGVAVVAGEFVYAWYDERNIPHRDYGHGPEARLMRGLCYGCGWDRIEHVAPMFRRDQRTEGHTFRSAADLITARFEEHAA